MKNIYITLLTSDNYLTTIISFIKQIKKYCKYDVILLCSKDLSDEVFSILNDYNIKYIISSQKIPYSEKIYEENKINHPNWNGNWQKLDIWNLIEYDKICYIDADVLVQNNKIDALFDNYNNDFNGLIDFDKNWIAPTMMLIKPNKETFKKLYNYLEENKEKCLNEAYVINGVFRENFIKNKSSQISLEYCTDISYSRRGYSNIKELFNNTSTIHFLGAIKPNMLSYEEIEKYYWFNEIELAKQYKKLIDEIEKELNKR